MAKPGRNDLCQCGSGKKFKKCCEPKQSARQSRMLLIAVAVTMLAALLVAIASFTGERSTAGMVWDPVHGHYHDANGVEVR